MNLNCKIINLIIVVSTLLAHAGCGGFLHEPVIDRPASKTVESELADGEINTETEINVPPEPEEALPPSRVPCELDPAHLPETFTIESITLMINQLPQPVTLACLIDVLPRPLMVNATSSQLSAQPAIDADHPRLFIFVDSVILSLALAGDGKDLLEFSQLLSDSQSVKGELLFPVKTPLVRSAAYNFVKRDTGTGTRCGACHSGEAPAGNQFAEGAFVSRALKPFLKSDVSLYTLKRINEECDDKQASKCQLLESLFRYEDPKAQEFPTMMPTFF